MSGESPGIAFNKLLQTFHSVTSLSPVGRRQTRYYRLDLTINRGGVVHASQRLLLSSRRSWSVRRCRDRWKAAAVNISELKNNTKNCWKIMKYENGFYETAKEQRSIWKRERERKRNGQKTKSYSKCKTDQLLRPLGARHRHCLSWWTCHEHTRIH